MHGTSNYNESPSGITDEPNGVQGVDVPIDPPQPEPTSKENHAEQENSEGVERDTQAHTPERPPLSPGLEADAFTNAEHYEAFSHNSSLEFRQRDDGVYDLYNTAEDLFMGEKMESGTGVFDIGEYYDVVASLLSPEGTDAKSHWHSEDEYGYSVCVFYKDASGAVICDSYSFSKEAEAKLNVENRPEETSDKSTEETEEVVAVVSSIEQSPESESAPQPIVQEPAASAERSYPKFLELLGTSVEEQQDATEEIALEDTILETVTAEISDPENSDVAVSGENVLNGNNDGIIQAVPVAESLVSINERSATSPVSSNESPNAPTLRSIEKPVAAPRTETTARDISIGAKEPDMAAETTVTTAQENKAVSEVARENIQRSSAEVPAIREISLRQEKNEPVISSISDEKETVAVQVPATETEFTSVSAIEEFSSEIEDLDALIAKQEPISVTATSQAVNESAERRTTEGTPEVSAFAPIESFEELAVGANQHEGTKAPERASQRNEDTTVEAAPVQAVRIVEQVAVVAEQAAPEQPNSPEGGSPAETHREYEERMVHNDTGISLVRRAPETHREPEVVVTRRIETAAIIPPITEVRSIPESGIRLVRGRGIVAPVKNDVVDRLAKKPVASVQQPLSIAA